MLFIIRMMSEKQCRNKFITVSIKMNHSSCTSYLAKLYCKLGNILHCKQLKVCIPSGKKVHVHVIICFATFILTYYTYIFGKWNRLIP